MSIKKKKCSRRDTHNRRQGTKERIYEEILDLLNFGFVFHVYKR